MGCNSRSNPGVYLLASILIVGTKELNDFVKKKSVVIVSLRRLVKIVLSN
jgi:hypothetical protein